MSYFLQDADSVYWQLGISTSGTMLATVVGLQSASTLFLVDSGNTCYRIGISTDGQLTADVVTAHAPTPIILTDSLGGTWTATISTLGQVTFDRGTPFVANIVSVDGRSAGELFVFVQSLNGIVAGQDVAIAGTSISALNGLILPVLSTGANLTGIYADLGPYAGAQFGLTATSGTVSRATPPPPPPPTFGTGNYALDFYNALSASDHEVQLPVGISWGAKAGPSYKTVIAEIGSGWEQRTQNWPSQRNQYEVSYTLKSADEVDELLAFFYARRGRAHSFRFKDWSDYVADRDPVVFVQGRGYQLTRFYDDPDNPFFRVIEKPCSGLVTDALGHTPPVPTLYDSGGNEIGSYSLDMTTGLVTGAAPAAWSGEFDVRARFDQDLCQFDQRAFNDANWENIQIIEIRSAVPGGGFPVRIPLPPVKVNMSNQLVSGGVPAVRLLAHSPRFRLGSDPYIHFDIPRTSPGNALIVLFAALGSEENGPITINNVWDGDITTGPSANSTPDSFDTFQQAVGASASATPVAASLGLTELANVRVATAAALPPYSHNALPPNVATLVGMALSCGANLSATGDTAFILAPGALGVGAGRPWASGVAGAILYGVGVAAHAGAFAATRSASVALSGASLRVAASRRLSTADAQFLPATLTGLGLSATGGTLVATGGFITGRVVPSAGTATALISIYGRLDGVVTAVADVQVPLGAIVTVTNSDSGMFDGTFTISATSVTSSGIVLSWSQAGADQPVLASPSAELTRPIAVGLVVDGVALAEADRVLVKDGASGADNGVYVVLDSGAVSGVFSLERSADCDGSHYVSGAYTLAMQGTVNGGASFYVQTPPPISPGLTSVTWASFDPGSGSVDVSSFTRVNTLVTSLTPDSPPPAGSTITITNAGTFNGTFSLGGVSAVYVGKSIEAYRLTWTQDAADEISAAFGLLTYSTGLPTGSTDIWYCMSGAGGATRLIVDSTLTTDTDQSQLAAWVLEFSDLTEFDQADHITNQMPAMVKLVSPTLSSTTTGSPPEPELFVAVQFSNATLQACDPLTWVWCGSRQKTTTPTSVVKSGAAAFALAVGDNQVGFVQNRPGGGCVSVASFK